MYVSLYTISKPGACTRKHFHVDVCINQSIKHSRVYHKSAKVHVKYVHLLNVRVKKYSRSQDSYVLQCILLKTFVRLMFAVLAIREPFLTVNFCRFMVYAVYVAYAVMIIIIIVHFCG